MSLYTIGALVVVFVALDAVVRKVNAQDSYIEARLEIQDAQFQAKRQELLDDVQVVFDRLVELHAREATANRRKACRHWDVRVEYRTGRLVVACRECGELVDDDRPKVIN